ncbi:MAG: AmmeMemoRadiSam system radical SAM enzyme [Bacillota bacterium]
MKNNTEETITCNICPHFCKLEPEEIGLCRTKQNKDGEIESLNYGQVTSLSTDPIEKKPLYHFHPGSSILSIGTWGCNFSCGFCQNWQLSQDKLPTKYYNPEDILHVLKSNDQKFLAFTYSEPLIWYNYILDTAPILKENDIKVVVVSNGYINPGPFKNILPYIDAFNIDLKAANNEFYQKNCGGSLKPVQETIKSIVENEKHLELTNLVITDENDNLNEIRDLVDFVAALNSSIPLHLSRYHPAYKFKRPATDISILTEAYQIASEKLDYVYIGNILDPRYKITYCPNCNNKVIERGGITKTQLSNGKCDFCQHSIYGEF